MWTPYKELQRTVENAISSPTQENYEEMVRVLQRQRQNFLTLLKNPVCPFRFNCLSVLQIFIEYILSIYF